MAAVWWCSRQTRCMRMRVDDAGEGDETGNGDDPLDVAAAGDPVPDRARPAETRDREECYRDLRACDQAPGRPPARGAGDQPRFTGDGAWTWKGLELGPDANRAADNGLAVRQAAEGRDAEGNYGAAGLTPAMRRIEAELAHGTLVPDTEKFALKSPDRFKEKLAKMISLEPDIAPGHELSSKIHDGIRYTFVFEDQFYTTGVRDAESRLTGNGYKLVERKPSWSGEEYKGINSQWRDAESGVAVRGPVSYPGELGCQAEIPTTLREDCVTRGRPRREEREPTGRASAT